MAGRTYRSSWSSVATAGSQDGGVEATQPSALVTRPACSCTSTCCSAVHPPPPSSAGMLVAHRPSSRARAACAAVTSAGSSPPPSSAVTSKPISSSANAAARFCRSRSASLSPYMESPSASFVVVATTTTFFCRRCHNHDKRRHPVGARRGCSQGRAAGFLTECSVYASIVVVPMASPGLPNAADAVVVGGGTVGAWCAYFLRTAGLERVVLIEKGVLGQGASSRAAGV